MESLGLFQESHEIIDKVTRSSHLERYETSHAIKSHDKVTRGYPSGHSTARDFPPRVIPRDIHPRVIPRDIPREIPPAIPLVIPLDITRDIHPRLIPRDMLPRVIPRDPPGHDLIA